MQQLYHYLEAVSSEWGLSGTSSFETPQKDNRDCSGYWCQTGYGLPLWSPPRHRCRFPFLESCLVGEREGGEIDHSSHTYLLAPNVFPMFESPSGATCVYTHSSALLGQGGQCLGNYLFGAFSTLPFQLKSMQGSLQ